MPRKHENARPRIHVPDRSITDDNDDDVGRGRPLAGGSPPRRRRRRTRRTLPPRQESE